MNACGRQGARPGVLRPSIPMPRGWWLMTALAGLAGVALPLAWLGPQAHEQEQALQQALASLRVERDAARTGLQTRLQGLERMEAELAALPRAQTASAPADALLLQRLALAHGLRLEQLKFASREGSLTPGPSASAEKPAPLTLQVRGGYRSLLDYLAALEQTGPAWSLKQLQISAGRPRGHRLSLVLDPIAPSPWGRVHPPRVLAHGRLGDPFGVPPEPLWARAEPPAVPRETVSAEPAPAVDRLAGLPQAWRAEFERQRGPLEALALRELFLTGTFRQGRVWVALMRAGPLVHTVAVGDYIGPDLGRVQGVDETGLELREIRRDASGRWVEQVRRWPVGGVP